MKDEIRIQDLSGKVRRPYRGKENKADVIDMVLRGTAANSNGDYLDSTARGKVRKTKKQDVMVPDTDPLDSKLRDFKIADTKRLESASNDNVKIPKTAQPESTPEAKKDEPVLHAPATRTGWNIARDIIISLGVTAVILAVIHFKFL